jgi:hypothetical protein
MQGACEKKPFFRFSPGKNVATFLFSTFLTASASRQVASTRWTCSSLVASQRFDWRQEVDHNRPIGACREHGLANAPQ